MKIYWPSSKASHQIPRRVWTACLIIVAFMLMILIDEIDCEGCIHDILKPKKSISSQKYKLDLRAVFALEQGKILSKVSTHSHQPASDGHMKSYHFHHPHRNKFGNKVRLKRFVDNEENEQKSEDDNPSESTEAPSERLPNKQISRNPVVHSAQGNAIDDTLLDEPLEDHKKLFKPIRIRLFFDDDNIEYTNTSVEYKRLKVGLQQAVKKMAKILSVLPVDGPLLFSRTPSLICGNFWTDQTSSSKKTHGRCAIASHSYEGEKCLDDFQIPEDHLLGYSIYKNNTRTPTHVLYEDGRGIPDSDTVIYVQAKKTNLCQAKDVIAYATYCQLDQHNRPVAGFANFCPDYLADALYNANILYLTSLHEFFHALGFSKDLFDKFQECYLKAQKNNNGGKESLQWVCEDRRTVSYIENRKHIVTPAVRKETQKHLNCSSKPGCPLENHVVPPLRTSSHWEGRFMQGSLMAPTIGLPHLTVIDRITLGVFEDTGWYHVNYDEADDLAWGRNAGCDFATGGTCFNPSSHYFCQRGPQKIQNGCHHLHLDKGRCESDKYLENCGVYKAHAGMQCSIERNETRLTEWKGEIYSKRSRCFIADLILQNAKYQPFESTKRLEGRCYLHRCNSTEILEVKVQNSEWKFCPEGSSIQFEGYDGSLECPPVAVLCNYTLRTALDPVTGSDNATLLNSYCAQITVTFSKLVDLHYQIGKRKKQQPEAAKIAQRNLDSFLLEFTKEIVLVSEVDETRIADVQFVSSTAVQFVLLKDIDWATLKPKDTLSLLDPSMYDTGTAEGDNGRSAPLRYIFRQISCAEVVKKLLVTVMKGKFKFSVDDDEYRASKINFTSPEEETNKLWDQLQSPTEKPSPTGRLAGIAVGSVCVAVLAAVGYKLWKAHANSSVSPAPSTPAADARYHPNNGSTIIASSESGSFVLPAVVA